MRNDPQLPHDPTLPDATSDVPVARPVGVYVISIVVGLESLVLALLGVWAIISAFKTPLVSMASGVFLIVLLLGLAAGLAAVSVNAFKGMRWTRSAAFVWQLLMVALAVPPLLEGQFLMGLAIILPAVAAAYYLFTPTVVAYSQRATAENPVL